MGTRGLQIAMLSLLLLGMVVAGCAKRPATTSAAAPAPAPAPSAPPAAPAPAAPPSTPAPPSAPTTTPAPPSPARPAPSEFAAIPELQDIHFDFDKYDIRPGDAKTLDVNAAWLKANANQLVLIEGHCDERGTNEYNLALGERRAKSTMNYLVSQGVQANRITIISYGEERPLCTEHNETCWAKNRRAHFLVKPR
jgi:peptidoglycan-associated lipoprotein